MKQFRVLLAPFMLAQCVGSSVLIVVIVSSNPYRQGRKGCPKLHDTLKSSNVGPVTFCTWNAVGIGTLPDDFDVRRTARTRHSVKRTNHSERQTGM
jgi:hypothetical protein